MAIENAVGQLREDLATGKVTEQDLIKTVESMGLTEGTKAAVLAEIQSSAQLNRDTLQPPAPEAQPEVVPQAEPLAPVTAEVSAQPVQVDPSADTSFFSGSFTQDTTFFDQLVQTDVKPKSEHKAAEVGTLVSMIMAADGEDIQGVMQEISADLASSGTSPLLASFLQEREQKEVGSINAALWQNMEALTGIKRDPQAGREAQIQVQEQVTDVKTLEKVAQLTAEVASNLTPEQRQYFGDFQHVTGEVMYRRAVDGMLSMKSASDIERATIKDWFTALLNPFQSVAGRYDQGVLLGIMQESFGEDVDLDQYAFKSAHADKLVTYLTDPNLTLDELSLRLEELKTVVSSLDVLAPDVNPVWSSELFDVIQDELRKANSGEITLGNYADAFDALDVTVVAGIVKKLPALAKMASIKLFGRASMNASWTPATIAEVNRVINSAIQDSAIASRPVVREAPAGVNLQTGAGSLLDAMKETNPAQASTLIADAVKVNPDAVKSLGVTPGQLTERMLPDPSSPLGVHPNMIRDVPTNSERVNRSVEFQRFNRELEGHSALTLLREGELSEVANKYAVMVAKNSRGTLHPSASEILGEESGGLLVRSVFGASKDGGYASIRDADNAAQFLFGEAYEILAKPRGVQSELMQVSEVGSDFTGELEFFIRSDVKIRPNTSFVNPFDSQVFLPSNAISDGMVSFSRRVETDLFDTISNYTDKANRLAALHREMLYPILRMNDGKDKADWGKMLEYGDAEEVVFSSKEHAESVLGTNISNRAWKAYAGARDFYDSMANVRQLATYDRLNARGFKSVYTPDGILKDHGGNLHVKPIVERPVLSTTKPDKAPLGDTSTVWGRELYDVTTGSYIPLTDELLDELYAGSNKMLVALSRTAEFTDDKFVTYAIVNTADIKPLSMRPMNIRKGHIDVNYKGEDALAFLGRGHTGGTSYKVEAKVSRKVNGVPDEYSRAVGIYANKVQADKARAEMVAEEIDKLGPNATEAEILAIEDTFATRLTVEGELEIGLDITGTTTGLPAHARKRGERLLGPDGYAHILDPEEALNKGVHESRRHLGVEAIDMLKERFSQTYGKFMDNYEGFFPDFKEFSPKWKDAAKTNGLVEEAERFHRFIMNQERSVMGKDVTMFLNHVDSWAESLRSGGKVRTGGAVRAASKVGDVAFQKIKELTTAMFIASRPLYQIMANSSQILYLGVQNPVRFIAQTLPRTLSTLTGLAFEGKHSADLLAKMFGSGMTGEKYQRYLKNMRESGMFSTNMGNDIYSTLAEGGKIEAGRHNVLSKTFFKNAVNPVEAVSRAGKLLLIPQRTAIDFSNLFAWNHAASEVISKKGLDYQLSRRGVEETTALARRLTFNQNRADQFNYQQNFLSLQLQFVQHVHRMTMDLVVDPTLRTVSLNKLKSSADGTNPYADTWAQSFMTVLGMSGVFGAGTYALTDEQGLNVSQWFEDQGVDKDLVSFFMDGLAGMGMEEAFGERFDVASRISPIGAMRSTLEMMFTNDGGLVLGGPSVALWDTGRQMVTLGKTLLTNEEMTAEDAMKQMKVIGTKSLAGMRDADKAYFAAKWMQYKDSNGKHIADVSDLSWIPIMFSIPPESVQQYYRDLDKVYAVEEEANKVAKFANNIAMNHLGQFAQDQIDGDVVLEAIQAGARQIELTLQDSPNTARIAKENFMRQMAFTPDGLLTTHAEKLFANLGTEDAKARIRRHKALHPEQAAHADMLLEFLEMRREE